MNGKPWTPEEEALLARLYPDGDASHLASLFGRSEDAVRLRAQRLGLRKSKEHIQKVLDAARTFPNSGRYIKKYPEDDLTENSPTYKSWVAMRRRCQAETDTSYPRYGAVGIKVCERWNDYANFLADMGVRPSIGHSIDRIDSRGNYEPGNCRWATAKEQQRNLRNNVYLTAFGETKLLVEWLEDERCSVSDSTLRNRLQRGRLTVEQCISLPPSRGRADGGCGVAQQA